VNKFSSTLPLIEVKGSPRACGRQYGESQAEMIDAFLHSAATPDSKRLRFAARSWEQLKRWDKPVVEFVKGMAEGSRLSIEEVTLLLLHEEIARMPHCTAIGATGPGTVDGRPIIAQNWDWRSEMYPWPGLLRMRSDASPAAIHYTFPGLWACAGINADGMALVWTSSSSIWKERAKPGIPTYALIAAILGCPNCQQALALLRRTQNAGFFIFFIADAGGEVWVVEGSPGQLEAVPCEDVITRANHYECEAPGHITRRSVRERARFAVSSTRLRAKRMATLARRCCGRIDAARVEAFLRDRGNPEGKNICQTPRAARRMMTIDSMYCLPSCREFRIARGNPLRHEYQPYRAT
jgi:hypothetical protein